jgi:hypothetical protein
MMKKENIILRLEKIADGEAENREQTVGINQKCDRNER